MICNKYMVYDSDFHNRILQSTGILMHICIYAYVRIYSYILNTHMCK